MDDLIVVILAAGSNQPKQPETFWDLIKNEVNIPAQEEVSEYYEEENPVPVISTETPYQKVNTTNVQSSVRKAVFETKLTRKKIKSKTMEGFSLRKAVVYSEILNRKYT